MKYWTLVFGLLITHSLPATNSILKDSLTKPDSAWKWELSIGFDFAQLSYINPLQGAGQNKLSLNSVMGFKSSYNRGFFSWENDMVWQFGAQRLGSGTIGSGLNIPVPFQKSIDDLRFNSKLGYSIKEHSKWLYSLNFGLRTLITPSFNGDERLSGNFFKDIFTEGKPPTSKFLSPAIITFSMGNEFKLGENLGVFYSPISIKHIIVEDDFIASTGVHGNNTEGMPDSLGLYTNYENFNFQFGSFVRATLQKQVFKGKLKYKGSLILFSNYLKNPQNLDFDMVNTLDWILYKNFNFSLLVNLFYDDDVLVQVTDRNSFGGTNRLGKRLSMTQQFLITYQIKF